MNDIYGDIYLLSSQSGHQGCIVKKVRKLCLNENWNTLENEITPVKIIKIVIYIKVQPLAQKNKFSSLHPRAAVMLLQFRVCFAWFRATRKVFVL